MWPTFRPLRQKRPLPDQKLADYAISLPLNMMQAILPLYLGEARFVSSVTRILGSESAMRGLSELVKIEDLGIQKIREWIRGAVNDCILLPPSPERDRVLLQAQVTTRSTLGAIVYETGGVMVDGGWLRFLGSGHPSLTRTLPGWNQGRSSGFYLVADDAVGGFFAINGGAFGRDVRDMYYWSPDSLNWEPLKIGFTDFFVWALSPALAQFYESLRWASWREETAALSGDSCFGFYPFLWTKEGSVAASRRNLVPVREAYDLKVDLVRQQLAEAEGGSLSSEEVARLLRISKTAVLKRLAVGRLLAWREERLQAARFPRWQFDEHGQVLTALEEVLEILNADERLDAWGGVLFFLQEKRSLGNRRPLDLLRGGKLEKVCLAAHAYAE